MVKGPQFVTGPPVARTNQLAGIVGAFGDQLRKEMMDLVQGLIDDGLFENFDEPSIDNLLAQRKALVAAVQEGMLERKDQEAKIGLLTALIWFNRLEEDRRARINAFG